ATLRIDLDPALHDHGPGYQNIVRRRHRAMPLIRAEMCELSTESAAPGNRVSLVARVTEVKCVGHFRYQLSHHVGVSAKPIACQQQSLAAHELTPTVALDQLDATKPIVRIDT